MLEEPFLTVNCEHLHQANSDLYSQLVRYPQEVIPTFDLATNELFGKLYPETVLAHQIQVSTALSLQSPGFPPFSLRLPFTMCGKKLSRQYVTMYIHTRTH